jgi:hypothetical protein
MQYFKQANKPLFDFEDKLKSLNDNELKKFCELAKKYGLSDRQIQEGIEYIKQLRK